MTIDREQLIEHLVRDSAPVRWWQRATVVGTAWFLVAVAYVVVTALLTSPFRAGVGTQLLQHPLFLLETLVALLASVTVTHVAFALSVPGRISRARAWLMTTMALTAWLAFFAYGLVEPALDPSMAGKRHLCYVETMTLSLPPLLLGLVMIRRAYPVARGSTGFIIGAAAGMIPAMMMQLACMYIIDHILTHHIAPIAAVSLTGGLLGSFVLRRRVKADKIVEAG